MAERLENRNIAVGFDAGSSGTSCAVLDADGQILATASSGPSNLQRAGSEPVFQELAHAAARALSQAGAKPQDVASVCAGLTDAGRRSVVRSAISFLTREFPCA